MADEESTDINVVKLQRTLKRFEVVTRGAELMYRSLDGLQVIHAHPGFVRFNFTVPPHASDVNGNWHVGAIATVMDSVGVLVVYSMGDGLNVTLNFNISYFSTAKIQEEVEIEAKVTGNNGKLASVEVKIRKKNNGELIAISNEWLAFSNNRPTHPKL